MPRIFGLVVALVGIASQIALSDDKKAAGELEGVWKLTAMTKEGKQEEKGVGVAQFVFAGEKVTVEVGGKGEPATFKADAKAKPATIDIINKGPCGKERTTKAIYKIVDDTLTICAALDDGERPKDFKADKANVVMTLEKVKK